MADEELNVSIEEDDSGGVAELSLEDSDEAELTAEMDDAEPETFGMALDPYDGDEVNAEMDAQEAEEIDVSIISAERAALDAQEALARANEVLDMVRSAGDDAVSDVGVAKNNALNNIRQAIRAATLLTNRIDANEDRGYENANEIATLKAQLNNYVNGGYVEDNSLYLTHDGDVVAGPFTGFGGGGGGGGGGGSASTSIVLVSTSGWAAKTIAMGNSVEISMRWSSTMDGSATGNGTLSILVNGITMSVRDVAQGNFTVDVAEYLSNGTNSVKMQVTDSYGNSTFKIFTVTVEDLRLTSTFDDSIDQTGPVTFPYTPYGDGPKTVYIELDDAVIDEVTVGTSGREQSYALGTLGHGVHKLRVWFEKTINGTVVPSNELYYEFICIAAGNNTPIISSSFHETSIAQFSTVRIPFRVYDPASQVADVTVKIDGVPVAELTDVSRTVQTFLYRMDVTGQKTISFLSGTARKNITLTVTESPIDIEAETSNLSLYLTSNGRSNNDGDRSVWSYGGTTATMTGFNWVSNGWVIDGDGITALRINAGARVVIPYMPFAEDFRTGGKTIEIEMAARDVRDYTATLIDCMSGGRGLRITAQDCVFVSEQSQVKMQYKEDDHVRIGFVVDKSSGYRLVRCYLDGILSSVVRYDANDNFEQSTPVGITIGNDSCTVDIYNIRIYDNDLTMRQMEENWIADTQDGGLMLERFTRNHVRDINDQIVISNLPGDLPYLILAADKLPQYKGDKVTVSGSYTDPMNPAKSFTFEGAQADVQGTSSQYYTRKNYKIKFKNGFGLPNGETAAKYAMRADSIPVSTFTFKADVASSEGANNVELVIAYNEACPYKTPAQTANQKVRQGIDGFPIVIFWQDTENRTTTFLGKYNFNNDKSSEEVFGFVEGDESWEIRNNTGNRVIWKSDDYTSMGVDKDGNVIPAWLNDFEARYPDTDPAYQDPAQLQEFATWVKGCDPDQATGAALAESVTYMARVSEHVEVVDPETGAISYTEVFHNEPVTFTNDTADYRKAKFRDEVGNYTEIQSALFYYLFTELFLMVDSRAKNAFPSFIGSAIGGE